MISIKNRIINNYFWLAIGKIVQAIISLIVGVLIVRYLGASDFGLINYVSTIASMLLPIAQLGQQSILVKEIVTSDVEDNVILGSSIFLTIISSVACYVVCLVLVLIFNNNEIDTIICCAIYSLVLVFESTQLIIYWFQARLLSKYTSLIYMIAYLFMIVYKVILLIKKSSVYFFSLSYSIDILLISLFGFIIYHKITNKKLSVSINICKDLLNKGKHFIIPGMLVTLLSQTDKIMLKNMINNSAIGIYAIALSCASMTSFIFVPIIDALRPVVLEKIKVSTDAFNNVIIELYSIIIYLGIVVGTTICLFSNMIVKLFYGPKFIEVSSVLMIVIWHTIFSYVVVVRDIWIVGHNRQYILTSLNIISALLNIVLNYFFIKFFGINGAAIATLLSLVFVLIVLGLLIKNLKECTILMIKSLNPKYIINVAKKIFSGLKYDRQ